MNAISRVLDGFDQHYARLTRIAMRLGGAAFVILGLALANARRLKVPSPDAIGPTYWPQGDPQGPFILGLMTFGLGVVCWGLAMRAPWRTFDRLLLGSFPCRDHASARWWDVVMWWELRRVPYNLIVGGFGILSGVISFIAAGISESLGGEPVGMPDGIFIIAAPVMFGIGANVFYTGGWIVELGLRWLLRARTRFAPFAFTAGLAFSVALTFLPAFFAAEYLLELVMGWTRP